MPNISRTKTWNANETLTAADLNAEFNGILTGVNDNTLNNDNLNQTDDYLFGSLVTGSGIAAGGGDGKLHVHVASAGSVTAHASGNDFVIEGTANPGMSFLSGASTTNSIYFGDVNDNDAGSIVYTHGTDMAFTVETVEVLTLAAASVTNNVNTFVGNGYGAVIGHTSQETISDGGGATDEVPEFQVLGTAAADMTAMIGGWSTTATRAAAPVLALVKSGHASIGSHTVVTDGEILGSIIAYGDDGTDLEAPAAAIEFAVDGTPVTGDMPGEIKFYTTADSGETLTLALTLSAAQAATFAGAVGVASLACTAAGTFGGGYGSTGATISTAGVIQANGAITSDGAVTGATLAGTISTATQNSITTATSLASVGTITSGTWSGVIDGSCTMTLGSDATGDIYYRDASGFLERLASGADGYVLTGTGAGSIPAWEAVAAGSTAFSADVTVANGYGLVVGGTAQQTISDGGGATDVVPEVQVLGTATADMTALIGGWSTTATRAAAPTLALLKSGNATIASHTVVTDDEILGSIIAYGDDGTDYESPAAAIEFAVDGTPGTGDMPGSIEFYTTVDDGETLTSAMRINSKGIVTMNRQPCFFVKQNAAQNNLTGNGEFATIGFGDETSEGCFDQGGNISGSTFTAPIAGKYNFTANLRPQGITSSHTTGFVYFNTNAALAAHQVWFGNPWALSAGNEVEMGNTILLEMDAGDTLVIQLYITGGATVVDISANAGTNFSGFLVGGNQPVS